MTDALKQVWVCNPHGVVCSMPYYLWDNGNGKGRKYDFGSNGEGYRLATKDEIAKELPDANFLTKAQEQEAVQYEYAELRKMAKEKGINTWGKKKAELLKLLELI